MGSGDTTANGYGRQHQLERERWKPIVEAGQGFCTEPVCLMPTRWIKPGSKWHLAHNEDRTQWRGPAHARCNVAERNRRIGRTRKSRPRPQPWKPFATSRQW